MLDPEVPQVATAPFGMTGPRDARQARRYRGSKRSTPGATPIFVGSMLLGWGLFNLVEGIFDHQVLGLHHVHPGNDQLAWDVGFLAFGATLAMAGITAVVAGHRRVAAHAA